jgi:hypothetical protein
MPWLDTDDMLRDFRDEFGADWRFAVDKGDAVFGAFFPDGYPTLVLIDHHGGIVFQHSGLMEEAELDGYVHGLTKRK